MTKEDFLAAHRENGILTIQRTLRDYDGSCGCSDCRRSLERAYDAIGPKLMEGLDEILGQRQLNPFTGHSRQATVEELLKDGRVYRLTLPKEQSE